MYVVTCIWVLWTFDCTESNRFRTNEFGVTRNVDYWKISRKFARLRVKKNPEKIDCSKKMVGKLSHSEYSNRVRSRRSRGIYHSKKFYSSQKSCRFIISAKCSHAFRLFCPGSFLARIDVRYKPYRGIHIDVMEVAATMLCWLLTTRGISRNAFMDSAGQYLWIIVYEPDDLQSNKQKKVGTVLLQINNMSNGFKMTVKSAKLRSWGKKLFLINPDFLGRNQEVDNPRLSASRPRNRCSGL